MRHSPDTPDAERHLDEPVPASRRWLLLVAVAEYAAGDVVMPDLPGVIVDVHRFNDVMRQFGRLERVRTNRLYNEQATQAAMLDAFDEMAAMVLETDQVVVYFGGHGCQCPGGDSPGPDGMTRYLLPYDATPSTASERGISTRELAARLARVAAEQVVVILDCCYAGGLTGVFWGGFQWLQQGQKSRYVMASAQPFQAGVDLNTGSPFTQNLCEALQGGVAAPRSPDGWVSAAAAYEYAEAKMRAEVRQRGILQMPTAAGFGNAIYLTQPPKALQTLEGTNHRGGNGILEALGAQLRPWLEALGYQFEPHTSRGEGYFEWIVNIHVRRGYDRVLVRGIAGRGRVADVLEMLSSVEQHSTDEGWLVVAQVLDQSVRDEIQRRGPGRLIGYTLDELIEEAIRFDPYFEWLDGEVERLGIDRLYVPLACAKPEFHPQTGERLAEAKYDERTGWMEGYLDTWLEYPGREHVSILGEFGTGKTWFALRYAWMLSRRYREAQHRRLRRPRLPLFIPLRDYTKALDVGSLLSDFFFRRHDLGLPRYQAFEQLNRMGRLLLIFDGFDEMAVRVDRPTMGRNFEELARVVVPGSKAILTSRIEHFRDIHEALELLNRGTVLFELLEVERLDSAQVRQALSLRADPVLVERVMANEHLRDLATRPVLIQYIIQALPDLADGAPIDLAHVYLYALCRVMKRDIAEDRTFTSEADKFYFFAELAWEMLTREQLTLNYREFPDRVRRLFKDEVRTDKAFDHWCHDLRLCGLLVRTEEGDYAPAHRSLLEFFVAYRFVALLGIMAPDVVAPAANQSHVAKQQVPRPYTWSTYFLPELDAAGQRRPIAPLTTFVADQVERIQELSVLHENSNVLAFAAGMVSPDPDSVQRLVDMALDRVDAIAWTTQSFLAHLKHHPQAEALARGIATKRAGRPLPSGAAWVLGELGRPMPEVVTALEGTVAAYAAGEAESSPGSWWEAAFALEKLDRLTTRENGTKPASPLGEKSVSTTAPGRGTLRQGDAPIGFLLQNLPPGADLTQLKARLAGCLGNPKKEEFTLHEGEVVLFVRHEEDPEIQSLFRGLLDVIHFASDTMGRRCYRMVWLCGHLGGRVGFRAECLQRAVEATQHPRGSVRNCALEALGKIGQSSPEVVATLERGLSDSYYRARFHAAWSLGQLGATASLPRLAAALRLEQVLDVSRELQRVRESLAAK